MSTTTKPTALLAAILVASAIGVFAGHFVVSLVKYDEGEPTPEASAMPGAITYGRGPGSVTVFPVTMTDGTRCVAIERVGGVGLDCDHSTRAP